MDNYLDGLRSMRLYRQANLLPTTSSSQHFTLENIASYTMELDIGDHRGFSTFTLRGVPLFLVDAFNILRISGLDASGIFRKEGNIGRLKTFSMQTFFGGKKLPEDCTTHDVCSLIKRFFRELKTPLFAHLQLQLLEIATNYTGIQRVEKLLETVRALPAENLATLAFLMRQLKYFGDRHEAHRMTVENIARVFAPSLFRDNPPPAPSKRKRGSQDDLIISVRNENELRIAIIIDLIDNAHKIGVPRDYYLASRRPSDATQKVFGGKLPEIAGMRSASAKPISRNTSSVSAAKHKVEAKKDRKMAKQSSLKLTEQYKDNIARDRRSSSTVRDFFTSISSKVLRRGLSPVLSGRRRCSAGDASDDSILRENMTRREAATSKFCVHNHSADASDSVQHASKLKFVNEGHSYMGSTLTSGGGHKKQSVSGAGPISPRSLEERPKTIFLETNIRIPSTIEDDSVSTISTSSSRHRSRRESPRKFTTANSKNKAAEKTKIIKGIRNTKMLHVSPAFEPAEMSTKHIGETFLKRRDADEKTSVSKIIKRNSSKKKLLQSVKVADSANSFLEGYSLEKSSDRSRRRHTAPVKASALLKRNQPNTLATGLKIPCSYNPERRSTILNVKQNEADEAPLLEKKKRRSESFGGDSCDRVSGTDDENGMVEGKSAVDSEMLLEQKCTNSRQRRAKRQRRREETKAVEAAQPVISLLDDVTNAINRMEKERKLKEGVPDDCENATMLSFTDTIGNDRDMESVTVKEEIPPPHQADSSLRDSPQGVSESADVASATNSALKKSSTKSGTAVTKKSMSSHCHQQITSASLQSTAVTVTSPPRFVAEAACDKTFFVGTPKRISKQRNLEIRCVSGAGKDIVKGCNQEPAVFGADFSKSDAIKKQLLKAKTGDDIMAGPAYIPRGPRPSVLSINTNNRGMVKQRVNLFAQLGTQASFTENQVIKTAHHRQDGERVSYSGQKPSAPPASHGLQVKTPDSASLLNKQRAAVRVKKFEGSNERDDDDMPSSPLKSPQQQEQHHRSVDHSLLISSSITARSPKIFVPKGKPRRPSNPFKNKPADALADGASMLDK